MRVESYPKELKSGWWSWALGFQKQHLKKMVIPKSVDLLSPFVGKDAIARFERAKAAMASGNAAAAISDPADFGNELAIL